MTTIDLNCDLGEDPAALGRDEALAGLVTSLNIACGGHAGDDASMRRMFALAVRLGRAAGAHPSYPDREGFGRVAMVMETETLRAVLAAQISAAAAAAKDVGVRVAHVKAHGALYHAAASRRDVAAALFGAMAEAAPGAAAVLPWSAPAMGWARDAGLRVVVEAFADRRYRADGGLVERREAGAVLGPVDGAAQAVAIALGRGVTAADGSVVPVRAETLCVHSDTPDAMAVAAGVRAALEAEGVRVEPPRLR